MLDGTKSLALSGRGELMLTESLVSSRLCRDWSQVITIIRIFIHLASQSFPAVLHTTTIISLTLELFILDTDSPVLTNFDKLPDVLVHYNASIYVIIKPLMRVAINEGLMRG